MSTNSNDSGEEKNEFKKPDPNVKNFGYFAFLNSIETPHIDEKKANRFIRATKFNSKERYHSWFYCIGEVTHKNPFPPFTIQEGSNDSLQSIYPSTPTKIAQHIAEQDDRQRWVDARLEDMSQKKIWNLLFFETHASNEEKKFVSDEVRLETFQAIRFIEYLFDSDDALIQTKSRESLNAFVNEILQFLQYQTLYTDRHSEALMLLYALARGANNILANIVESAPDKVTDLAKTADVWPLNISPLKSDTVKMVEHLNDTVQLGKEVYPHLNKRGRSSDYESDTTWLSLNLIKYVQRLRLSQPNPELDLNKVYPIPEDLYQEISRLPELSESTADKWGVAGWKIFTYFQDKRPDDFQELIERIGSNYDPESNPSPISVTRKRVLATIKNLAKVKIYPNL